MQLTSQASTALERNHSNFSGMTAWGEIAQGSIDRMRLDLDACVAGTPALMLKHFDNGAEGKFEKCDFSLFATTLPDGIQPPSKVLPVARLRYIEDGRRIFRGDPRGTLRDLFVQIELRFVRYRDEDWIQMVAISW